MLMVYYRLHCVNSWVQPFPKSLSVCRQRIRLITGISLWWRPEWPRVYRQLPPWISILVWDKNKKLFISFTLSEQTFSSNKKRIMTRIYLSRSLRDPVRSPPLLLSLSRSRFLRRCIRSEQNTQEIVFFVKTYSYANTVITVFNITQVPRNVTTISSCTICSSFDVLSYLNCNRDDTYCWPACPCWHSEHSPGWAAYRWRGEPER